ncbi:MAG: hypothetical protein JWM21_496 [Acidobacteria bacterium]|nr:hypothetical protein [Acidobacteriota bacterium]
MSKFSELNSRRDFLRTSVAAAAGLGCLSLSVKAQHAMLSPLFEDAPNTHNMMVVGARTVYISHLPMFDNVNALGTDFTSPHRRQVIMEATFSRKGRDLTSIYTQDRMDHPKERMYTLKPSEFVLGRVDPGGMALKKFRGKGLFRGHLERGGCAILGSPEDDPADGSFDVNVKNVVHFHKFDPKGTKPAHLEYLLFGKGPELFLAHFITLPDDFDQIVSVKAPGHGLTDAQLGQGLHVVVGDRDNTALTRMKEKDKGSGTVQLSGAAPKSVSFEVVREFYFEESELATKVSFGQTAEETKSGFPD